MELRNASQPTKSLLQTVSFCRWRLRRLARCWNVGSLPRCVAQPRIVGVRIQYDALPRILQIALLAELVHILRYDFPCRANILGEQFVSEGGILTDPSSSGSPIRSESLIKQCLPEPAGRYR